MRKVLLVDDERRMLDLLSIYLTPVSFSCIKVTNGNEAIDYLQDHQVDLVLLDVMMPKMDGWETCQQIREFSSVPIIMLTARDEKQDVIKGLKLGADDYVAKPFDEGELMARIEAVFRRTRHLSRIEFNELIWDEDEREVSFRGKKILLTPKEFSIIGILINNINRVFSREQLIEKIWGFETDTEGRTIDSHVRNLREKIRQAGFPIDDHLQTVWGVGYKWI